MAYLLSFSIIMLNTDLHNPNIKQERKMTLSQFVSQNKDYGKDVSQGKVLPLDYLVSIYNSIKSSEFEVHKKTPGGGGEDKKELKGREVLPGYSNLNTNTFKYKYTCHNCKYFYINCSYILFYVLPQDHKVSSILNLLFSHELNCHRHHLDTLPNHVFLCNVRLPLSFFF